MKRALMIEDNPDNSVLISKLLKRAGYQVLLAETGEEGCRRAVEDRPDFVLLDIQLPDIDGLEVLSRIRAETSSRKLPVIAVTSYAMSGDRERMLAAGCNGYIEKPIDPHRVIAQIRGFLND
ncbi:MAG: response regulator [Sedimenticola sp.]